MVTYVDSPSTWVCLSTDTKPDDFTNGSVMLEMDTSKIYMFDSQNKIWREFHGFSGGGGAQPAPARLNEADFENASTSELIGG